MKSTNILPDFFFFFTVLRHCLLSKVLKNLKPLNLFFQLHNNLFRLKCDRRFRMSVRRKSSHLVGPVHLAGPAHLMWTALWFLNDFIDLAYLTNDSRSESLYIYSFTSTLCTLSLGIFQFFTSTLCALSVGIFPGTEIRFICLTGHFWC